MFATIIILIFIYAIVYVSIDYAPNDIYYPISAIIYIALNAWYIYKYRKGEYLCFELFFALSFFACSFLTLFILPTIDDGHRIIFALENSDVIFKAHIVAYLGYLMYMLGLTSSKRDKKDAHRISHQSLSNNISKQTDMIANVITSLLIILFFINGGNALYTMYSDDNVISENRLEGFGSYMTYATIAYMCSIVTSFCSIKFSKRVSFKEFLSSLNPIFIINSAILIISFTISGYRSMAIQLLIPLLLMYNRFVKPINVLRTLLILFVGLCVMIYIGEIRQGNGFDTSGYQFINYFRDFFSANAANIFLIDYTDHHGPMWSNTLFQVLSIIPGLQGVVKVFFPDLTTAEFSSSIFTDSININSGLGTNIIGDLYYSFGFWGVLICMYIYGLFVNRISLYSHKNIYALIALVIFSGNAIFAARVEYFYILRSMSFSVIFLFLLLKLNQFFGYRQYYNTKR